MKYPDFFVAATTQYATHEKQIPAPMFRGCFSLECVVNTELKICGLGLYRVFCNGTEITRGRLSSCPVNPDQILYYDTYDITPFLQIGKNVIGVILGNGMLNCNGGDHWDFGNAPYRSAPKVAFSVTAGGQEVLSSSDCIKTHSSPITYDDLREGESYDARLEISGWNLPGFDDRDWASAMAAEKPKGRSTENMAPPVIVSEEILPCRYWKTDGGYIYEYPINTSGICRLQLHAQAGQKITMQHVEALDPEGKPFVGNLVFPSTVRIQYNEYICKDGWQVYEPSFTYCGFRYVFVTGLEDSQANEQTLIMLRMHAALEKRAFLHTSDKTVNQLCAMIDNSNLSNLLHFPTDCPHREKNGWAGDISVSAHQMTMQYDMQGMFGEWMRIYRMSQRSDGALPGYVPTVSAGYEVWTGPSWSMSLYLTAYYLYRYHGNLQPTEDNADAMEAYFDYMMGQRNADGLIAFGLGDWCQTTKNNADWYSTPNEITDSCAAICIAEIMSFLFAKIGRESEKYEKIAAVFREALREKWLGDEFKCKCDSQTAQAMMIHYGIFRENEKLSAVKELVERIHNAGDIMDVGVLGGYILFDVLAENGYAELAQKLILQEKSPSYGYFAARNETTLRETLIGHGSYTADTIVENGQRIDSLNHHFWGFIYTWFVDNYTGVVINENFTDPNYVRILKPRLLLDSVVFRYQFPGGVMNVHWEKTQDGMHLQLTIPAGVTVCLLKNKRAEILLEGEYCINL